MSLDTIETEDSFNNLHGLHQQRIPRRRVSTLGPEARKSADNILFLFLKSFVYNWSPLGETWGLGVLLHDNCRSTECLIS